MQNDKTTMLHLDFKGITFSPEKTREFITYLGSLGYQRIFFELDCRYPWKTWPGAARPLFTKKDIRQILQHCRNLGIEAIPLIQIQGHLEWILVNDSYAYLRENGNVNELCPSCPDSKKLIRNWIDEALELFEHPKYIHLGGDETSHLASCPVCGAKAEKDSRGKLGIYADHVGEMCRYALKKQARPIIWGDILAGRSDDAIPPETIVTEWVYYGRVPKKKAVPGKSDKYETWGASAIQCGWHEHWWNAQNHPVERLKNIDDWNRSGYQVIHTTWGRPSNLWNLYPPVMSLIPLFKAASPQGLDNSWRRLLKQLEKNILLNHPLELAAMLKKLEKCTGANEFENGYLEYARLAVRYQMMVQSLVGIDLGKRVMEETIKIVGRNEDAYHRYYIAPEEKLQKDLPQWLADLKEFFTRWQLSDFEEYSKEKASIFKR